MVNNSVKTRELRSLDSMNTLKKLDALVQLKPDVLICGGITDLCKKKLSSNHIMVFPWVQGEAEQVLKLYMKGLLTKQDN